MRPLLLALALTGCLSPPSGLVITGASPAEVEQIHGVLAAAISVTGDEQGHLRGDLGIRVVDTRPDLFQYCVPTVPNVVGCNYRSGDGFAIVVLRDGLLGWVAHECCHIGLSTYDETYAASCAVTVLKN